MEYRKFNTKSEFEDVGDGGLNGSEGVVAAAVVVMMVSMLLLVAAMLQLDYNVWSSGRHPSPSPKSPSPYHNHLEGPYQNQL